MAFYRQETNCFLQPLFELFCPLKGMCSRVTCNWEEQAVCVCVYRDSLWLCALNSGTSFVAGFAVFSTLGFMAKTQGIPINMVVDSGKQFNHIYTSLSHSPLVKKKRKKKRNLWLLSPNEPVLDWLFFIYKSNYICSSLANGKAT